MKYLITLLVLASLSASAHASFIELSSNYEAMKISAKEEINKLTIAAKIAAEDFQVQIKDKEALRDKCSSFDCAVKIKDEIESITKLSVESAENFKMEISGIEPKTIDKFSALAIVEICEELINYIKNQFDLKGIKVLNLYTAFNCDDGPFDSYCKKIVIEFKDGTGIFWKSSINLHVSRYGSFNGRDRWFSPEKNMSLLNSICRYDNSCYTDIEHAILHSIMYNIDYNTYHANYAYYDIENSDYFGIKSHIESAQ